MLSRIENQTEIAVFDAGEEWVSLEDENRGFLPSETYDLNDQEVRKAQQVEFPEEYQHSADSSNGKFLWHEELLYSISRLQGNMAVYPRLMLPAQYSAQVLTDAHVQTGLARSTGMRKEVQQFVDRCGLCQMSNTRPV